MTSADAIRIRLAGVGGTGVVTVAQILATAAMFDGWSVHGLDQTGLSQKAGPVVSDLVLHRHGTQASNLVGRAEADVLIAFDGLVACADNALAAVGSDSVVLASTHETPTGQMISSPEIAYPRHAISTRLAGESSTVHELDAHRLAVALTGHAAAANVLLLGAALQTGAVPISVAAVERAIELNGVAVDANLNALSWGRRWIDTPEAVDGLAAPDVPPAVSLHPSLETRVDSIVAVVPASQRTELTMLLHLLAGDLEQYQDRAFAHQFLDHVAPVALAEAGVDGSRGRLTIEACRGLHRFMAIKDEYEVARLMLLPEVHDQARRIGGANATITWKLHPPMLKALGLDSKIAVAAWATPAVRALAMAKRLRGTWADPFGRTEHRRLERSLLPIYVDALEHIVDGLTAENLAEATAIAALADQVRGFEDLKTERAKRFIADVRHSVANYRS